MFESTSCYVDHDNWMACVRQVLHCDKWMQTDDVLKQATEMCSYKPATPRSQQEGRIDKARLKMYQLTGHDVWKHHYPYVDKLNKLFGELNELLIEYPMAAESMTWRLKYRLNHMS